MTPYAVHLRQFYASTIKPIYMIKRTPIILLPVCFSALLCALLLTGGGCGNGQGAVVSPAPAATASVSASASPTPAPSVQEVPSFSLQAVKSFPHDRGAFTQGLVVEDGKFIEGTGLNGKSSLRRVVIETGAVEKKVDLSNEYFGEGLTVFKGKIYQLTWKNKMGFIYDAATFKKLGTFPYTGEGWGLTHDDTSLILSDGTNIIRFLDPETFKVTRSIEVFNQGSPENNLNELEYIKGEIYANIWQTDFIARIDPKTGKILGLIDCTGLLSDTERQPGTDVLNGIAYDEKNDRLYFTGKNWPRVFQVELKKL